MAKGVYPHESGSESSHYKHGLTNTRIHRIWANMKTRCYNPKSNKSHLYLKRGITVCDEWRNNFESFYKWSMEHGYSEDLTLDRIDNGKGYSPDNCRWVTYKEQRRNQRAVKWYEYNGVRFIAADTLELFGIKPSTFRKRISEEKSLEAALKEVINHS